MTVPAFNSVAWFEFGTDQPEKVKEFYGELFDWSYALSTNTPGVTYHSVMPPGPSSPRVACGSPRASSPTPRA
ncbi:hypothetical protein [Streptomyces scabiei]|uniref:Uncharacterized protein n=1 Tax=Streptomyces scabiei TaxID=1930 RepID=A0A100JVJ4_STRSC|nr:hypothetical protein [Streptomyces scabiei]GAQ66478.1 hypothetical protein SsS58_06909 [Streptomyces scabiei]